MSKFSIISNYFPLEICNIIMDYESPAKINFKQCLNKIEKIHISKNFRVFTHTEKTNRILFLLQNEMYNIYYLYADRFSKSTFLEYRIIYSKENNRYIYEKVYNIKDDEYNFHRIM